MSIGVVADSYVGLATSRYATEVMADAPLGYWRMDQPSNVLVLPDSSGFGHDGAYADFGGSTRVSGLLAGDTNGAQSLGGKPWVPYAAWMNTPAGFTAEVLIKATAITGTQNPIDRDPDTGNRYWQLQLQSSGALQFIFWTNTAGPFFLNSVARLVANTTYHLAISYDGANARLYVNGTQDISVAQSGVPKSNGVGRLQIGFNSTGAGPFTGIVDEVAYYGSALSAARIAAHRAASI